MAIIDRAVVAAASYLHSKGSTHIAFVIIRYGSDDIHKFILGTHTSNGEQNYLMVGSVQMPSVSCEQAQKTRPKGTLALPSRELTSRNRQS